MRLYLVRHGRTASNIDGLLDTAYPGVPLDSVGRAQADALVGRFDGVAFDAIYSSDIVRAVETANPLANARGQRVRATDGLREIPAGDQELSPTWGPYVEVLQAWGAGELSARRPGGEDGRTFLARYDAAITAIAQAHDVAVAVSHGAAMRTWLMARVPSADALSHQLGNTAIVALDGVPGSWELASWDEGVTDDTPDRSND